MNNEFRRREAERKLKGAQVRLRIERDAKRGSKAYARRIRQEIKGLQRDIEHYS